MAVRRIHTADSSQSVSVMSRELKNANRPLYWLMAPSLPSYGYTFTIYNLQTRIWTSHYFTPFQVEDHHETLSKEINRENGYA